MAVRPRFSPALMERAISFLSLKERAPASFHTVDFSAATDEGRFIALSLSLAEGRGDFLAEWTRDVACRDVHYDMDYLRAEARHQDGEILLSRFDHAHGTVYRSMVMRPIRLSGAASFPSQKFDLITPFEYGGPIILCEDEGRRHALAAAAQKAFEGFCREHGIISEFIRFHPLLRNVEPWIPHYNIFPAGPNVVVDLQQGPERLMAGYSRGQRRNIERSLKHGVTAERVPLNENNMAVFENLYGLSMERLGAVDYYKFTPGYFSSLAAAPDRMISIYLAKDQENDPISGLLVLHGKTFAHSHLLGDRLVEGRRIPHTVLYHVAALDQMARRRTVFHLGGAASNQMGVRAFKERLSPERADYFTGSRIYDQHAYEKFSLLWSERNDRLAKNYFPAYRAPSSPIVHATP